VSGSDRSAAEEAAAAVGVPRETIDVWCRAFGIAPIGPKGHRAFTAEQIALLSEIKAAIDATGLSLRFAPTEDRTSDDA
jgi:DNA-binding transcriptional MerR regulator